MYLSIFFLDHFEKCETKCSRKTKSTRPVENFFSKKSKPKQFFIWISKYHQTKNGLTKSNGLLFCIRVPKVQICKSYVFYQKYVSVPKMYQIFLSFHASLGFQLGFTILPMQSHPVTPIHTLSHPVTPTHKKCYKQSHPLINVF